MTQEQIVRSLGEDQSTISGDVKFLRKSSQAFIYDLARSDLAPYYKNCIDSIDDAKRQAWDIYSKSEDLSNKDRIALIQLIVTASIEKFKILSAGPSILVMLSLEDRLSNVEAAATTVTQQQGTVYTS